ncbi:MAG: N-acetyltransferase family protein [Burkholderiales bacterium]
MKIREATKADAHAIAEVHVAAWRSAYRGLLPDAVIAALTVEERRAFWKDMLAKTAASKVAVGESDGAIAAFCSYGPTRDADDPEAAEIYALYVHPAMWRQGCGRALCEHAWREAARREHTAITLWVMKGNDRALRFYEHIGFAADGAQRTDARLIDTRFDELRYRKPIA